MSQCLYVPPIELTLGDTLNDSITLSSITPPATVPVVTDLTGAVVTYGIIAPSGLLVFSCATNDGTNYITLPTPTNGTPLVAVPPSVTANFPVPGPLSLKCKRAFKILFPNGVVKTYAVRDIQIFPSIF